MSARCEGEMLMIELACMIHICMCHVLLQDLMFSRKLCNSNLVHGLFSNTVLAAGNILC
jgi:hypothetical protein